MKIEHLEVLVNLSKTLNFTKTAQQLNITQPAVSKIIASIEEELNTQLIVRNSKKVSFTTNGAIFTKQIETILMAYQNSVAQVVNSSNQKLEILRIGYTGTPYEVKYIPELIHEFKKKNTKINLYIANIQHNELQRGLLDQNIDVMFTTKDDVANNKKIGFTSLGSGHFHALIPSDFNIPIKSHMPISSFNKYPIIIMNNINSGPELIKLQNKIVKTCKDSHFINANNIQSAIFMVNAGLGICFLPKYIYNAHTKFVRTTILEDSKTISYGIAYLKENHSETLINFKEFMSSWNTY
ncbi:LysR family transcriptional regulator [Lactobacillus sp. HT06-2]|uniref:LysR family transcriptional regulator n=1 Tax=Lactobacillus sp. HT06-2 TaxID=2080222 RepID=UPI000CD9B089|nr:LysR family transcriptional regulator [Lactobacillus sp. HT06-2]